MAVIEELADDVSVSILKSDAIFQKRFFLNCDLGEKYSFLYNLFSCLPRPPPIEF